MLRSVCRLESPLWGLLRTLAKQQGSLARAFIEIDDVKKPLHWHLVEQGSNKVEIDSAPLVKEERKEGAEKYQRYLVTKEETANRVHVNLEDLSPHLQSVFAKSYLDEIKQTVTVKGINAITFNNITEDVFRYCLNMPIRKLGFFSHFERYNDDRGVATFTRQNDAIPVYGYKAVGRLQRKPRIVSDVEIVV